MTSQQFLKYWLPLFIWIVVMFISSSDLMSSEHTSRFILPFLFWIKPGMPAETILTIMFGIRKCAHVSEYAILALLVFRAFNGTANRGRSVWIFVIGAWMFCVFVAATDEFHQSFVPSRTGSIRDVGLDSIGAFVGSVIGGCFAERNSKKARRKRGEVMAVES